MAQGQTRREEYLKGLRAQESRDQHRTVGSLWTDCGALVDLASDFKARKIGDTIVIDVVAQTYAQASGNVVSDRSTATQAAITGLPARLATGGVNPLFSSNSGTKLKGSGALTADSTIRSTLAGEVIAVLPNGNLVVEAKRAVQMNGQKETILVRGVLRPGDVVATNSVLSSALMNLEIELQGKGVITDATRRTNPVIRTLLWLVGF